ncbi:MAG: acetyl-CoA carboxylase biotin carboxyl carrier protein subunit [Calditrichaeota bacterium]|nr:MAG: acetyl-CoA carboxylase biotin carboxyl carrier protein subunit [Calditrichota bacterium]
MSNLDFLFEDETITTKTEKTENGFKVIVGDEVYHFVSKGENLFKLSINGQSHLAAAVYNDGKYYVDIDSVLLEFNEPSSDGFAGGGAGQAGEKDKIFAPMPGKIVKLQVAVGDEVNIKQQMVVVEAMKMENQVISKAKGKVKAINFAEGDQVDTDSPIIELELDEE